MITEIKGKQDFSTERKCLSSPIGTKNWQSTWLVQLQDPKYKPYTEQDERIFEVARKAVDRTNRWLGIAGYSLITIVAGSLTFFAARATGSYIQEDRRADALLAVLFGVSSTLLSNICSMLFTGTFPNASSNAQNADQNSLLKIKDCYNDLALFMLLQYANGNKDQIKQAAKAFDIGRIQKELEKVTTQQDGVVEEVVKFLKDSLTYLHLIDTEEPNTSSNTFLELQLHFLNLPYKKQFQTVA